MKEFFKSLLNFKLIKKLSSSYSCELDYDLRNHVVDIIIGHPELTEAQLEALTKIASK